MFVGAYWSERRESREESAARIAQFLEAIGRETPLFAKWANVASTNAVDIADSLDVSRKDIDNQVIAELGYRARFWNEEGISLNARIGAFSRHVGNSVVLSLDRLPGRISSGNWRTVLEAMIRFFEPERAVVTSDDILERRQATNPWDAGWLVFDRGGGITEEIGNRP